MRTGQRRFSALTALALSASLALAACGSASSQPSSSASPSAATATSSAAATQCSDLTIDTKNSALPTVSGVAGSQPTLEWTGKAAPENLTVATLEEGDGEEVTANSTVTVNYAGWMWDSNETFDSSYSRGQTTSFALSQVIQGWRCGLEGHKVGDRLLISIPANLAYGDDTNQRVYGPLVFVVEIARTFTQDSLAQTVQTAAAQGAVEGEQTVADRGISLTGGVGEPATISVNEGAAEPTEVETLVYARGTGPEIQANSEIIIQIASTTWDNSLQASSWEQNAAELVSLTNAPGLQGLVGLPSGSRVVFLIPGNGQLPAQAFVVDAALVQ